MPAFQSSKHLTFLEISTTQHILQYCIVTICIKTISNLTGLDDLKSNLRNPRLAYQNSAEIFDEHYIALGNLAEKLQVIEVARRNAYKLAKGYRDLVLLTQEPEDSEHVINHAAPRGLPPTVRFLSQQLQKARGTRNSENTFVVDVRSFRSSPLRGLDNSDSVRMTNDSMSYDATKDMVEIQQPDVLVIFQTVTASELHNFARRMSSSIRTSGQ